MPPTSGLRRWARIQSKDPPGSPGAHHGFRRAGAELRLLFMSDESEQWDLLPDVDAFAGAAGHPDLLRVYDITGGPTGCSSPDGAATAQGSYGALSEMTGGASQSICATSRFGEYLGVMDGDIGLPILAYPIPVSAAAGTVSVLVDDGEAVFVPEGWTWDEYWNAVVLPSDEALSPGATVQVAHWPAGECP